MGFDETINRNLQLLGGDWNHGMDYDFPYIGKFVTPTDELAFFRGVLGGSSLLVSGL